MIHVQDLVYEYPTRRVLHAVNFAIEAHTITALVGPNGAGKTTLLRCLAALEYPFSGSVVIDGYNTAHHPRECHRQMGYLSDFFGLYDALTVRRSLTYLALAHHLPEAEIAGRVKTVAHGLGLTTYLDQPTRVLSRGLRQRVAIGQAIIHQPRVLLLDEPAAGLDPEARHELSRLLTGLRDEGMTIVVSSHILAELEEYSTHMLVLRDGRIQGHQALGQFAPRADGARLSLRLCCHGPAPGLHDWLAGQAGVADLHASGDALVFSYLADPARRAALLRALLDAPFPLIEFAEQRQNLQDLYLAQTRGSQA